MLYFNFKQASEDIHGIFVLYEAYCCSCLFFDGKLSSQRFSQLVTSLLFYAIRVSEEKQAFYTLYFIYNILSNGYDNREMIKKFLTVLSKKLKNNGE